MTNDLLDEVLSANPPAFALLHRPDATADGWIDIVVGNVSVVGSLAELPVPGHENGAVGTRHEVLVVLPYRQLAERGFACVDDGSPLIAMKITGQGVCSVGDVLRRVPDVAISLAGGHFDVSDARYADLVRTVVAEEIGRGEGANFVLKRSFRATITDYAPDKALALFRRLLERETGAYWTFLVHIGERTFVGATPERHLSLREATLVMNPISGTYRYPPSGPTLPEVIDFLADRKEADELYMVVDEELKMMAKVCEPGVRLIGPFLKEMASVAHTEYFIEGRTSWEIGDLLRETMFAPTVVGSPLESACRIVRRYEPEGRGYYSGVVALIGRDEHGERTLDSSILIRTADIDSGGRMRIGVGATIVRHSHPDSEVAETRAKAAGLLSALGAAAPVRFASHPDVRAALSTRNATLARFWRERDGPALGPDPVLAGRRMLVVDAEDTFTSMIGHQLRSLGLLVTVRRFDDPYQLDSYDLVIMGPGPGDPTDHGDPKVAHLRATIRRLLDERRPFLGVCLSHQVLSTQIGLTVTRREVPNQGVQKEIDLFGRRALVGFYNTFAAQCDRDVLDSGAGLVEVGRDRENGEVHALRGPGFCSMQFHAESILTQDGLGIVRDMLTELVSGKPACQPLPVSLRLAAG